MLRGKGVCWKTTKKKHFQEKLDKDADSAYSIQDESETLSIPETKTYSILNRKECINSSFSVIREVFVSSSIDTLKEIIVSIFISPYVLKYVTVFFLLN